MNIRDEIVAKRRVRVRREGHELGARVSKERGLPVLPFGVSPGVICEVKRRSPSRGDIAVHLDPVKQVSFYAVQGVRSVSVLTEEDYFSGSLEDLKKIKQAYPKIAALRKDFLLDLEDIDVSYRAGADAVLLIASILDAPALQRMHSRATELGMAALIELHNEADVEKARNIAPPLVGINSRDLETFTVDPLHPVALKAKIDWPAKLVYESGILGEEDSRLAASSGFDCVLVGEAVVRKPALVREITIGMENPGGSFWEELYARSHRPLVKICGITGDSDFAAAAEFGADLIGFIFAPSPRRVDAGLLRSLGQRSAGRPLRVGVVISTDLNDPGNDAIELFQEGLLDAVQFHGDEEPSACYRTAFPYYKALSLSAVGQVDRIRRYRSPRVLVDARANDVPGDTNSKTVPRGGTGKLLPEHVVNEAAKLKPLWLAGGLNPGNIYNIVSRFSPELVDVSSGVEKNPGVKDHNKLRRFFEEIRKAR